MRAEVPKGSVLTSPCRAATPAACRLPPLSQSMSDLTWKQDRPTDVYFSPEAKRALKRNDCPRSSGERKSNRANLSNSVLKLSTPMFIR